MTVTAVCPVYPYPRGAKPQLRSAHAVHWTAMRWTQGGRWLLVAGMSAGCGLRLVGVGDGMDAGSGDGETSTSENSTAGTETDATDDGPPPTDLPPDDCPGLFEEDEDPTQPKAVGPNQPGVYELDQDANYLVWVSSETRSAMRLSKCDGSLLVLDDDIDVGNHVAIGKDRVVMNEHYGGGNVFTVNLDGGGKVVVQGLESPMQPDDVEADDEFAYWVEHGFGDVLKRKLQTGAGSEEGLAPLATSSSWMTIKGDRLYVTDGRAIKWMPKTGGPLQVIGEYTGSFLTRVRVDETHAYSSTWVGGEDGVIIRMPLSGGGAEVLVDGQRVPTHIALDADFVYWTNQGAGTVVRMPKDGGAVEVLADEQGVLEDVEVDEDHVYWATLTGESVMARALP